MSLDAHLNTARAKLFVENYEDRLKQECGVSLAGTKALERIVSAMTDLIDEDLAPLKDPDEGFRDLLQAHLDLAARKKALISAIDKVRQRFSDLYDLSAKPERSARGIHDSGPFNALCRARDRLVVIARGGAEGGLRSIMSEGIEALTYLRDIESEEVIRLERSVGSRRGRPEKFSRNKFWSDLCVIWATELQGKIRRSNTETGASGPLARFVLITGERVLQPADNTPHAFKSWLDGNKTSILAIIEFENDDLKARKPGEK